MAVFTSVPETHLDILKQEVQGVVSTVRHSDGRISTNPIAFDWDGEQLRFSTLKQRVKYHNLVADPRITVCVTSSQDPTRYVEIRGRAELQDDPLGAFQLALWQRMTGEQEFNFDPPGAQRVTVTIVAEQVSAPSLYAGQLSDFTPQAKG
jgi:PPOX class probable F420-dependent enzyme